MEIVQEDPGRRLALEETTPRMPMSVFAILLALVVLLALPWRGLWAVVAHGAGRESLDLAGSGLWVLAGLLCVGSLRGGSRLESLVADRAHAGRFEWTSSHMGGLFRWRHRQTVESLSGFTLALAPKGGLRLALRPRHDDPRRDRVIDLRVKGVEGPEEIADLALRLGAAAGLSFYRVLAKTPLQFEIEVRRQNTVGFETMSGTPVPAVALPSERLPAFDPARFRGKPRVTVWEPGREVRFEKPWGASLLLSPLALAALLGPWASMRLPSLSGMPLLPRFAALILLTFTGLAIAAVGVAGAATGWARRVILDWSSRTLSLESVGRRRTIPFADVVAIEMRSRTYRGRRGMRQYTTSWWIEIRAIFSPSVAPQSREALLVETSWHNDDPTPAQIEAMPLATELARTLGVEKRGP